MDKVEKASDSVCYTPWSDPFRMYEENRITRDVRVGRGESKRTHDPSHELLIAQERNNSSIVLTEMSAGCPGGLEVSTADQYSQDPRFKTNPLC
jgi:hypothetical protein